MTPAIELLCRSLSRRDKLTPAEEASLASLTQRTSHYARGSEIIAEMSRPSASCLLVEGLAGRAVSGEDGTRQLSALHIPGDFVDLHGLLLRKMDHSIVAISNCTVAYIPHESLIALTATEPHLTRMLWTLTAIDAAIQRKMTALLGRHTPAQRLAHLLCEIYTRLEIVGLSSGLTFHFPITQTELSDVLGLSVVHTNRTVGKLRALNLISWNSQQVDILDMQGLKSLADFDPTYLSLQSEPR
ncbi:MAG: Crp/Fnr family transcriptional regulator [Aliihoeflea sp.]